MAIEPESDRDVGTVIDGSCCWLAKALKSSLLFLNLQVLTRWQITVTAVEAFPRSPDIVAMTNALAAEAGEPSAQALIAAAEAGYCANAGDACICVDLKSSGCM